MLFKKWQKILPLRSWSIKSRPSVLLEVDLSALIVRVLIAAVAGPGSLLLCREGAIVKNMGQWIDCKTPQVCLACKKYKIQRNWDVMLFGIWKSCTLCFMLVKICIQLGISLSIFFQNLGCTFFFIAEAASLVRQIQTWKSTFCKHRDKWYVTMAFWMPSYLLSFLAPCC